MYHVYFNDVSIFQSEEWAPASLYFETLSARHYWPKIQERGLDRNTRFTFTLCYPKKTPQGWVSVKDVVRLTHEG